MHTPTKHMVTHFFVISPSKSSEYSDGYCILYYVCLFLCVSVPGVQCREKVSINYYICKTLGMIQSIFLETHVPFRIEKCAVSQN